EMLPHCLQPELGVAGPQAAGVQRRQSDELLTLPVREIRRSNTFVRDLHIVPKGRGLDPPVRTNAALRWQDGRQDGVVQNGLAALIIAQRIDEVESVVLVLLQHARTAVNARLGDHWLGSHEYRCNDDLVADHEAIDDQVMAVDLPTPRLVLRRLPEK